MCCLLPAQRRFYKSTTYFGGPGHPIICVMGGEGGIPPSTGIFYPFIKASGQQPTRAGDVCPRPLPARAVAAAVLHLCRHACASASAARSHSLARNGVLQDVVAQEFKAAVVEPEHRFYGKCRVDPLLFRGWPHRPHHPHHTCRPTCTPALLRRSSGGIRNPCLIRDACSTATLTTHTVGR